jgi:hypothetical protein
MSNAMPQMVRLPAPSDECAEEFGRDIYGARLDPSDPEACFNHLHEMHPERWRELMANLDGAIYAAGQLYINAEMVRAD